MAKVEATTQTSSIPSQTSPQRGHRTTTGCQCPMSLEHDFWAIFVCSIALKPRRLFIFLTTCIPLLFVADTNCPEIWKRWPKSQHSGICAELLNQRSTCKSKNILKNSARCCYFTCLPICYPHVPSTNSTTYPWHWQVFCANTRTKTHSAKFIPSSHTEQL